MDSNIQNFFQNKVVFVTGGTGFLGKVLIEKLLRTTDIKCIYILIRPKRDKDITQRFSEILKEPLFENVLRLRPQLCSNVKLIAGDCTEQNLGISLDDRQELRENVQVIIHCAATIRFNESLSLATQVHVQATMDMIDLAKEMKKLESYVHVSTAFVNCVDLHSEECLYTHNLSVDCEKLLNIKDRVGIEGLDKMTQDLLGKYPNTYSFTKAITEEAVFKYGKSLPICILRPGIVLPACEEPLPGWIDNCRGASGLTLAGCMGILRVVNTSATTAAPVVPVDFCANIMLAAAWYNASKEKSSTELPIYNLVPEKTNPIVWGSYWRHVQIRQSPFASMIWIPMALMVPNTFLCQILAFIYHTIPYYCIDGVEILLGKEARMVKIYETVNKLALAFNYFITHEFTFVTTNTNNLWQTMSPVDQSKFNFDMHSLRWSEYLPKVVIGLRRFYMKEDPETIPQARRLWSRLFVINCLVHCLAFAGLLWMLWTPLKSVVYLLYRTCVSSQMI